jgi:outer membrane receptor protein involved in Fe transport
MRASAGMSAQYAEPSLYGIGAPSLFPERATSIDAGGEYRITPGVRLSVTGFHRSEENVLRRVGEDRLNPVTGARIMASPFPEYAPNLDGTSRGVDVTLMRRGTAGLTGWVAYTWAHTDHDDVVSGEHFDADYDQRHTLNVC